MMIYSGNGEEDIEMKTLEFTNNELKMILEWHKQWEKENGKWEDDEKLAKEIRKALEEEN